MKRALRTIVPILLILAVVACIAWYLLVYDRDFTKDVLLHQARAFESAGNHKAAAWLYDVAYFHSSGDDSVAIELAEQYKAVGNYTKAEYTLSQAISEKSSAALYKALCATYVEQDKLLDAVNMLDSITDPAIKAELDAARPQVPTASPDPAFYSQYISVTLDGAGCAVYASADGEYPSTAEHLYAEPIALTGGETVIYAVAVNEELLVSPLGIYGYTVGGVIEAVTFTDAAIETSIRTILGAEDGRTLYTNDLWSITEFTVPAEATVYTDLALLPYLRSLTVENSTQGGLEAIGALNALEALTIRSSKVSSDAVTAIGTLANLQSLTIENCSLSTIAALSSLTGMHTLDLSGNTIRNISAVSSMTGLQNLDLSSNAITDVSALSGLTVLKSLDISYNSVTTIAPLHPIATLEILNAGNNQIQTVDGIRVLSALLELDLSHNKLTNVSEIAGCEKLTSLNISNNTLDDIGALGTLSALTKLDFSYNLVSTIPVFAENAALITINGSYNKLTSLDPLSGLPALNNVLMDYNPDLSSLEPLDSCPLLIQVNVYGTKVKDAAFLTKKSVIVNFDPTL